MIITIDGPTASGKSTIAKKIAEQLRKNNQDIYQINSGLFFRAAAYILSQQAGYRVETIENVSLQDIQKHLALEKMEYTQDGGFLYNNIAIVQHFKTPKNDKLASIVSQNKNIRDQAIFLQREVSKKHNVVVDGRDSGSVVFPNAEHKFFVTADITIRAQRWQKDQDKKGNNVLLDNAIAQITERDQRDKMRTIAPLIIPKNAVVIDTTHMNIEQVVAKIFSYIKNGEQ